jgi:hypothetical protein
LIDIMFNYVFIYKYSYMYIYIDIFIYAFICKQTFHIDISMYINIKNKINKYTKFD